MSYTCAVTGETGTGKHYVLKTTEGEELVSPDALLVDRRVLEDLAARVARLEDATSARKAPAKKTPAQRKAVD